MIPKLPFAVWLVEAGLAGSLRLVQFVFLRYPGVSASHSDHLRAVVTSSRVILRTAGLSFFLARNRDDEHPEDSFGTGIQIGVVAGLLWIAEISFNNFLDRQISTGRARFYVDNGF